MRVCVCVCVCPGICALFMSCSPTVLASIPPMGTEGGQDRKWASFLSSHCCVVVGAGRLELRWRGNSGGERRQVEGKVEGGGTRNSANVFAVRLLSLCLMYCLNLTIWQKCSPAPEVEDLRQTLYSVLSQKINNTVFCHYKLSECPLGTFTCLWEDAVDREPGKRKWGEAFQSTLSLLLEWTGWHWVEHGDEKEAEEKVLVAAEGSLGLCFWCRAIAARMLMMCTWKYMDLGKKGGKTECNFVISHSYCFLLMCWLVGSLSFWNGIWFLYFLFSLILSDSKLKIFGF